MDLTSQVLALPDECDACKAKPGSPILCALCLAVRKLKGDVRQELSVKLLDDALNALGTHGEWLTEKYGIADVSMPEALVRATANLEHVLGKR